MGAGGGLGHRLWDDLKQPPAGGNLDRETLTVCVTYVDTQVRGILPFQQGELMGRKTANRSARKRRAGAKRSGNTAEKPVALTLKVDSELYLRLSTLRATQRRTNQDILEQALKEYLTHAGT